MARDGVGVVVGEPRAARNDGQFFSTFVRFALALLSTIPLASLQAAKDASVHLQRTLTLGAIQEALSP